MKRLNIYSNCHQQTKYEKHVTKSSKSLLSTNGISSILQAFKHFCILNTQIWCVETSKRLQVRISTTPFGVSKLFRILAQTLKHISKHKMQNSFRRSTNPELQLLSISTHLTLFQMASKSSFSLSVQVMQTEQQLQRRGLLNALTPPMLRLVFQNNKSRRIIVIISRVKSKLLSRLPSISRSFRSDRSSATNTSLIKTILQILFAEHFTRSDSDKFRASNGNQSHRRYHTHARTHAKTQMVFSFDSMVEKLIING